MPIQIISAEELDKRKRQQPQIDTQEPTLAPSVSQPVPATPQQTPVTAAPQERAGTLGEQFQAGVEEMKGWGAQFIGMAPAASEKTSRTMAAYQQAKQEKANKVKMAVQDFGEVVDSPSKIFQYGAERLARSAPGMVPYTVPVVGTALGAGTSFATTAGRIYGEQEDKDAGKALLGATGSAALETLGMGKLLSKPGMTGVAKDIGTSVVTEGATEGGQQIIENIASGKEDVFEGVGEAIASGGVIGGGIRTVANVPQLPKAARETARTIGNVRRKFGGVDLDTNPKVKYEIGRAVDNTGELYDINAALVVERDENTRRELLNRRRELNNKSGGAAFYKALDEMNEKGITLSPEALDMDINEGLSRNSRVIGFGAELAGFSPKDVKKARRYRGMAKAGLQAKMGGQTPESVVFNNRRLGRDYLAQLSGNFNEQVAKLSNIIIDLEGAERKASPDEKAWIQENLFKLRTARTRAENLSKEMKAESRDRSRIYDSVTNQANDLDEFMADNNISLDFNPIEVAQKYIIADKALTNQDPSFHEGMADEAKDIQDLAMRGAFSAYTMGGPELAGLIGRVKDRKLRKRMQAAIEQTRRLAAEDMRKVRREAEEDIVEDTPPTTPAPTTPTATAPMDAATQAVVAQAQAISPETQPIEAPVQEAVQEQPTEAPRIAGEDSQGMVMSLPEQVVEEAPVEAPRVAGEDSIGMIPVIDQVKESMMDIVSSATDGNADAKAAADKVLDSEMGDAITHEEVMDVVDDALGAAEEVAIKDGDADVVAEIREVRDQVDMLPIPQMVQEITPEVEEQTLPETTQPAAETRQPDLKMVPALVKEVKAEYEADPTVDSDKVSDDDIVEAVILREPDLGMIPQIKKSVKEEINRQEEAAKEAEKEAAKTEEPKREPDLGMVPAAPKRKAVEAMPTEEDVVVTPEPETVEEVAVEEEEVVAPKTEPDLGMIPKAPKKPEKAIKEEAVEEVKEVKKEAPKTSRELVYSQLEENSQVEEADIRTEEIVEEVEVLDAKAEAHPEPEELTSATEMVPPQPKKVEEPVVEETLSDAVEEVIVSRNPDLGMIPKQAIEAIDKAQSDVDNLSAEIEAPVRLGNLSEVKAMQVKQKDLTKAKRKQLAVNTLVEKGGDIEAEDFTTYLDSITHEFKEPDIKRKVNNLAKRHVAKDKAEAAERLKSISEKLESSNQSATELSNKQWSRLSDLAEEYGVDKSTLKSIKDRFAEDSILTAAQQASVVKELHNHAKKSRDIQKVEDQWNDFEAAAEAVGVSKVFVKELKDNATSPTKGLRELNKSDRIALQKEAERVKKDLEERDSLEEKEAEGYSWDLVKELSKTYNVPMKDVTTKLQKFVDTDGKPRVLTSAEFKSLMSSFEKYKPTIDVDNKSEIAARWAELDELAAQKGVSEEFVKNLKRKSTKAGKGLQDVPSASWDAVIKEGNRIEKEVKAENLKAKQLEKEAADNYSYKFAHDTGKALGIEGTKLKEILGRYVDTSGKPRNLSKSEFNSFYSKIESVKKEQLKALEKEAVAKEKAQAEKDIKAEQALLDKEKEAAERDAQAAKLVKKTAQWTALSGIVKKLGLPKNSLDALKMAYRNPESKKLEVIPENKYRSIVENLYKDYYKSLDSRKKAVENKRKSRLDKAETDAKEAVKAQQMKEAEEVKRSLEDIKAKRSEDLVKLKAKLDQKLESRKQQNRLRIEAAKRRVELAKKAADEKIKSDKEARAEKEAEAKALREKLKRDHDERMAVLKGKIAERRDERKAKQDEAAKKFAEKAEAKRKEEAEQNSADLYVAQVQFLKNVGESLKVNDIDDIIDTAFGRIAKPLTDNKLRSLYAKIKGNKSTTGKQDSLFKALTQSTTSLKEAIESTNSKVSELEKSVKTLEQEIKNSPKVDVEAIAKEVSENTASQMLDNFEQALAQGKMELISQFNKLAKELIKVGKTTKKAAEVEEASRVVINVKRRMDRRRESGYDKAVEGMKGANGLFTREDVKQIQAVMGQGAFTSYMGPMGANFRGEAFGIVRPAAEQPMFNTLEDYKKAVKGQQPQTEPTVGILAPAPKAKPQAKPEVTTYADVEKEVVQPVVEKQEKVEQAKAAETVKAAEAAKTESKKVDADVDALAAKIAEAQKALKVEKPKTEKPKATKPAKTVKPKTDIEAELGYKAESLKSAEHAKRSPTVQKLLDKYKGDAKTITPIFREVGKTVLASDEALSKKANTLKDSEKPVFQIQQGAKALGIKGAKDLPSKKSLTEAYDKFMSKKTEEVKEEQQQALIERSEAALEKLTEAGVDVKKAEAPATKKPKSAPKQVGMTQRARTLLKEEINDRKDDLNSVEADLYDASGEVKKDLPKGEVTELKKKAKDLTSQINKLEKKLEDDDSKKEGARKKAEAAEEKADKAKPKKLTKAALAEVDLSKGDENDIIAQAEEIEARLAKIAQAAKKVPAKTDEAKKAAVLERRIVKAEENGDSEENLVVVDENNKIVGMVKDEDKALAISKKTPKSKVMTLAAALAIGASVSGAASAAEGETVDEMLDRYVMAGILTEGQGESFSDIGEDMIERSGKSLDKVVDDLEGLLKTFDPSKNKDVPKRKRRTELSKKLGMRESSNNYKAENRLGYLGKYQFGSMALQDLGMVKPKPKGMSQRRWLNNPKAWTGRFDINSKKEFLNNPQVQEKVFNKWEDILNKRTKSRGLEKFIGKNIDGVKITRNGINAASHLLGHGTVQKALRSGNLTASDANNVTIKEYLNLMN